MEIGRNNIWLLDKKCLKWSLGLILFSLFVQILSLEILTINSRPALKNIFEGLLMLINISLLIVIMNLLIGRVINFRKKLKQILRQKIEDVTNAADSETFDTSTYLTDLRNHLTKGSHFGFLWNFIICFVAIIFGFSGIYKILYLIDSTSFSFPSSHANAGFLEKSINFIYFSFVTMATVGYGDIVPDNAFSKISVIFEIMVGMIFLIIMINIYFSSREGLIKEIASETIDEMRKKFQEDEKTHRKAASKCKQICGILKDFKENPEE